LILRRLPLALGVEGTEAEGEAEVEAVSRPKLPLERAFCICPLPSDSRSTLFLYFHENSVSVIEGRIHTTFAADARNRHTEQTYGTDIRNRHTEQTYGADIRNRQTGQGDMSSSGVYPGPQLNMPGKTNEVGRHRGTYTRLVGMIKKKSCKVCTRRQTQRRPFGCHSR